MLASQEERRETLDESQRAKANLTEKINILRCKTGNEGEGERERERNSSEKERQTKEATKEDRRDETDHKWRTLFKIRFSTSASAASFTSGEKDARTRKSRSLRTGVMFINLGADITPLKV